MAQDTRHLASGSQRSPSTRGLPQIELAIQSGLLSDYAPVSVPFQPGLPSYMGLLKSHLQKAVRRSLVDKALRSAVEWMDRDCTTFLRRLVIICIEDAKFDDFQSEIPVAVWLMWACSVTPDPQLPEKAKSWLIAFVAQMTKASTVLRVGKRDASHWPLADDRVAGLSEPIRNLIWSLRVRYAFGGMNGDMAMLQAAGSFAFENAAHIGKCAETALIESEESKLPLASNQQYLPACEWIPECADFHCTKIVSDLIAQGLQVPDEVRNLSGKVEPSYRAVTSAPRRFSVEAELWIRMIWWTMSSTTDKKQEVWHPKTPMEDYTPHRECAPAQMLAFQAWYESQKVALRKTQEKIIRNLVVR